MNKHYHDGVIRVNQDGKFSASYLNRRLGGKPYQATAGYGFETIEDAKAAIDRENGAQEEYLSRVDAVDYESAKALNRVGATWYKPSFGTGGRREILRVVYIGDRYLLSVSESSAVYLSMGNGDCEFAFKATGDVHEQARRWAKRFEAPVDEADPVCHYCGMSASGTDFFGSPACEGCGG
jgi:hypothetical protein